MKSSNTPPPPDSSHNNSSRRASSEEQMNSLQTDIESLAAMSAHTNNTQNSSSFMLHDPSSNSLQQQGSTNNDNNHSTSSPHSHSSSSSSRRTRASFNSVRDTLGNLRNRLSQFHHQRQDNHYQSATSNSNDHSNTANNDTHTDDNDINSNSNYQQPHNNNNSRRRRSSLLQQLSDRLTLLDNNASSAHTTSSSSRVPLQVIRRRRRNGRLRSRWSHGASASTNDVVQNDVAENNDTVGRTSVPTTLEQTDAMDTDTTATLSDEPIAMDTNNELESSSPPPPPPPRRSLTINRSIISISARDLTTDEGRRRHHSPLSSPPTTSSTTARSSSSSSLNTNSIQRRRGNTRTRSSLLFASRNSAHQSVREGSSNVILLASFSSSSAASMTSSSSSSSTQDGSSSLLDNNNGGLNIASSSSSGATSGNCFWYGFGDLGNNDNGRGGEDVDSTRSISNSDNSTSTTSSSSSNSSSNSSRSITRKRSSTTDLGTHLHPVSREKRSSLLDDRSKSTSSSVTLKEDNAEQDQETVMMEEEDVDLVAVDDAKVETNVLYSWGKGLQSLHDDNQDRSILVDNEDEVRYDNAKVSSRLESKSILTIASGQNHSVCATARGTTFVVGSNLHGCVDPNLPEGANVHRPQVFESLSNVRVVQVSCGYDHTAALSSNGSVWTWGGNSYGELGHRINNLNNSKEVSVRCRPTGMALGKGRRASAVACGTHYTLVLTTHMSLLACGKPLMAGHREPSEWGMPKQLPTLVGLPLVGVAAGDGHAVVITAHGTAFVWGENRHACCGRDYPAELTVPLAMKVRSIQTASSSTSVGDGLPISDELAIKDAACGLEHTVLVTRSGRLLVCGNNNFAQLGFATSELHFSKFLTPVVHPSGGHFIAVEAGYGHSLILDDDGDVWMTNRDGMKRILAGKSALSIAAGGNNSAVITAAPTGTKLLQRQFSMEEIDDPTSIVDAVYCMIEEMESGRGDATNISREIARKSEELLRYPSYLNSLFVNPKQLDSMFERLLGVCSVDALQELARAFERGIKGGLDSLRDTRLIHPEAVRCLLQYILFFDIRRDESVVFDVHGETISTFCDTILSLPFEGYKALYAFATLHYNGTLFVKMLVKPLLRTLNVCAIRTIDENDVEHFTSSKKAVPVIVAVLSWLYAMAEEQNLAKPVDFYSDAVSEISIQSLFSDLYAMKKASPHERSKQFFITQHPFLLSPGCKRNLLQMESQMSQFQAFMNISANGMAVEPFFKLEIEREYLVEQTLECIKQANPKDIRKRLRVSFKGEEGLDAGGVTKEFFQLLSEELFDIHSELWSNEYGDEVNWFNSDNTWDEKGYEMIGVLVGLALYNNVLLDVRFPPAVYRKLLGLPLGLEDIVDAELRRGLKQLLDYEGDDVEDIFCLSFEVTWMELGEERRLDLKPDGANIPVNKSNREEYVLRYVSWILVDSVKSQWEAFQTGVMRIMEDASLDLFLPEELELLVVGSGVLDFKALESNTTYEGGYSAESDVIKNFWLFVDSTSKETQVQLLKFATASTKAPIGGLGKLSFIIQRAGPDTDLLPTSHTCFNTLLLPDYGSDYEKLANNLSRAVLECEGFGLE